MFPQREIKIQSFRKLSSKKGHRMNEFKRFLRVVGGHEKTDFLLKQLFLL